MLFWTSLDFFRSEKIQACLLGRGAREKKIQACLLEGAHAEKIQACLSEQRARKKVQACLPGEIPPFPNVYS